MYRGSDVHLDICLEKRMWFPCSWYGAAGVRRGQGGEVGSMSARETRVSVAGPCCTHVTCRALKTESLSVVLSSCLICEQCTRKHKYKWKYVNVVCLCIHIQAYMHASVCVCGVRTCATRFYFLHLSPAPPGPHFAEYLHWDVTEECEVHLVCKVSIRSTQTAARVSFL